MSTEYRVVERAGTYRVQTKKLFGWFWKKELRSSWGDIYYVGVSYDTITEACSALERYRAQDELAEEYQKQYNLGWKEVPCSCKDN